MDYSYCIISFIVGFGLLKLLIKSIKMYSREPIYVHILKAE